MSTKESRSILMPLMWIVLAAVLAAGAFLVFRDTTPPTLALTPDSGPVGAATSYTLTAEDPGSGLKSVVVTAVQGDTIAELERIEPLGAGRAEAAFTLPEKTFKDGEVTITAEARDTSFYPFGAAGSATASWTVALDTKAPRVSLSHATHNLNQGGSGLAVYTVTEETAKTGIQVGERFFPGYKLDCGLPADGQYACLFAMPYDTPPGMFRPMLVAVDEAGNVTERSLPHHANARNFRNDVIRLSDGFLQSKMPEFAAETAGAANPLEQFLMVNRDVRKANRAALYAIGLDTTPCPMWQGAFVRMHNAAPRADFADERDYVYHGDTVDHQTHLGIDLASLQQAEVPAANAGIVVFADYMGIYGNCVIIDHGLGLQTLYAHLSSMAVAKDDTVQKGQTVGRTGVTGMAGGDHLHYGVLVSGLPVNPREWWDGRWIEHNIAYKLE